MTKLGEKYKFQHSFYASYNPSLNGQAEDFNKGSFIANKPRQKCNVRLAELEALDEKRLAAQKRLEIYQAQVAGAFNRKVKFRSFSIGDLVLTVRRLFVITRKMHGKFEPKWEGPYVTTKVFSNGVYELSNSEGKCIYPCVNGKFIKKFYA
ncbi:hypothetical protein L3X38_017547 [Prunus dulcis]|uniref:Transposable element protein n=1 Tax=Prunus dulcis TaxID=3755 RepID=A0AAD4W817_PRUDU|nr:hypothetical protein L3X38_017547 [Prunus dulcis]